MTELAQNSPGSTPAGGTPAEASTTASGASADRPDALPLGPGSLVWQYFGDRRIALIGPRPAVLQNMLAGLGQGVHDHSVFFADTAARIKRSLPPIYRTVYGTEGDNAGPAVREFHTGIKGALPESLTTEANRGRYHALDPETYFWAHATFFDQVLYFTDTFVRRLSRAEKEQMYLEAKTWYRRYGVSDRPMPPDYAAFEKYWEHMIDEVLVAHPTARYGVGYVTKGFPRPKGISPLVWKVIAPLFNPLAAFLTTGGMPPRAREILALPWDDRRDRRYQRFAAVCRSSVVNLIWDALPMTWRYTPYAREGFDRTAREGSARTARAGSARDA
ncbi:MAG: DUF2236 domain-containing protein [Mycobacterium sp.]|nr:DUF2236 domain-containing protein [Mycobacterium sp.]